MTDFRAPLVEVKISIIVESHNLCIEVDKQGGQGWFEISQIDLSLGIKVVFDGHSVEEHAIRPDIKQ